MNSKRILSLFLGVIMAVSLAGCASPESAATQTNAGTTEPAPAATQANAGTTEPTPSATQAAEDAPVYQDVLRIGLNSEPVTVLTPTKSTSAMCHMLARSTHSTLVDCNLETGEITGDLAESWDVEGGGTEYVFHLRQNVSFSNGQPLTADDVVYTLMTRVPEGAIASLVKSIVSVEAVDDYTVKITLSGAQQDILYTLSSSPSSIVCKSAVESEGDEGERYGTGAYSIEEYVLGEYVTMIRNDNYFGEIPNTREIKWSIYTDDSSRELALETGEIDICYSPANADLAYISSNSELELVTVTGTNVYYVGFNTQAAPFNDEKVRQAIASCINKEDAITVAFNGYAEEAENVMAPSIPLYTPVEGWSYDPEAAKALLAESGYPDGFTATIWVDRADEEQMSLIFKENLAAINITLEVVRLEPTTLKASWGNDDYQMCLQKFGNTAGPGISFSYVFASTASANRSRINDSYVDEMIAKADVEADLAARTQLYAELNSYITNAAYWAPVCIPQVFVGARAGLQGAKYAGNTAHDFTYAYYIG